MTYLIVKVLRCLLNGFTKSGDSILNVISIQETPLVSILEWFDAESRDTRPYLELVEIWAVTTFQKVNEKVSIFCFHN